MKIACFFGGILLIGLSFSPLWGAPGPADIQGTWGLSFFTRDYGGKWTAEGGKAVFNNDGSGLIWLAQGNSDGQTSPLPLAGTAFAYSASSNTNGTLDLIITIGANTEAYILVFSDLKNMVLVDGTRNPALARIGMFVKLEGTYSSSDVIGNQYFGIGYQLGLTTPRLYSSYSFDATGGFPTPNNISGTALENQNGITGLPYHFDRNFSVILDGRISLQSPWPDVGYISGNRNVVVFSQMRSFAVGTYLALKKGDKSYATADLAGQFLLVGIGGQENGGLEEAAASIASLTCEATGHCILAIKKQTNGRTTWETFSADYTVNADGSFGGSVAPGFPVYGAALGNGGNALIFNPSFLGIPSVPEIFIGVRCSDCTYPFIHYMPLILKN